MAKDVTTLVLAILSYLNEKGIRVSKTKLLKLVYLFDVEFFRRHGVTFSEFDWRFYHLGPWTDEYEDVLSRLRSKHLISEIPFSATDFEGVTLMTEAGMPLRDAVANALDESELIRILNDWGAEPTGGLLDYVYFRTEPMEHGIRNERLDFSSVNREQVPKYRRSSSAVTSGLLAKKKREYATRLASHKAVAANAPPFTPPRYDEEFFEAMENFERLQNS